MTTDPVGGQSGSDAPAKDATTGPSTTSPGALPPANPADSPGATLCDQPGPAAGLAAPGGKATPADEQVWTFVAVGVDDDGRPVAYPDPAAVHQEPPWLIRAVPVALAADLDQAVVRYWAVVLAIHAAAGYDASSARLYERCDTYASPYGPRDRCHNCGWEWDDHQEARS